MHSSIFNKSLEQHCENNVENWNVEEYMNCSTFQIYSSTFFNNPQKSRTTLWTFLGKLECGRIYELFHITYLCGNKELFSYIHGKVFTIQDSSISYKSVKHFFGNIVEN